MTLTDNEIRDYLRNNYPWYLTDAGVSMLRGASTLDELRSRTIHLGRDGKLPIAADYQEAVTEHFSIYAHEEDYGMASRQQIYERKKAADEATELASLRSELKNVRIVSTQRERLDVNTLTLPTLRQHKADIADHKRMKSMSSGDLRAEYLAKHPAPKKRLDGYPILPQQMVLPNGLKIGDRVADGIHAVEMTPELIHAFSRAKSDSAEWHFYRFRLVRAYGAGQVTERQSATAVAGE